MKQKTLIHKLGGVTVLADKLGQNVTTVANWHNRPIPWRFRPEIAKLSKRAKIELPSEFMTDYEAGRV